MPGGPHSVGLVLSNQPLTHNLVIDNGYRLSTRGGSVTVMYVREGSGRSFLTALQHFSLKVLQPNVHTWQTDCAA